MFFVAHNLDSEDVGDANSQSDIIVFGYALIYINRLHPVWLAIDQKACINSNSFLVSSGVSMSLSQVGHQIMIGPLCHVSGIYYWYPCSSFSLKEHICTCTVSVPCICSLFFLVLQFFSSEIPKLANFYIYYSYMLPKPTYFYRLFLGKCSLYCFLFVCKFPAYVVFGILGINRHVILKVSSFFILYIGSWSIGEIIKGW